MSKKNIIIDDCGMSWTYSYLKGKIYCIEAENELREKFNENPNDDTFEEWDSNGYYADDFNHGVELLGEYGYISK